MIAGRAFINPPEFTEVGDRWIATVKVVIDEQDSVITANGKTRDDALAALTVEVAQTIEAMDEAGKTRFMLANTVHHDVDDGGVVLPK